MPDPVLTLLKFVFLAVLYLFFLRVLRAVWVETREPRPAPTPPQATSPAGPAPGTAGDGQRGRGRRGRRGVPERLVVVAPDAHRGAEFPLADELTVGRAGGCAVRLDDDTFVSSLHARLFRRDGDLFVEDLGSTNGTFVNGKKVTTTASLRKGDKVQFGRTTFEVRP